MKSYNLFNIKYIYIYFFFVVRERLRHKLKILYKYKRMKYTLQRGSLIGRGNQSENSDVCKTFRQLLYNLRNKRVIL